MPTTLLTEFESFRIPGRGNHAWDADIITALQLIDSSFGRFFGTSALNDTGITIDVGTPVRITVVAGVVYMTPADMVTGSIVAHGIVVKTIDDGSSGFVLVRGVPVFGAIDEEDIPAWTFTIGDNIYVGQEIVQSTAAVSTLGALHLCGYCVETNGSCYFDFTKGLHQLPDALTNTCVGYLDAGSSETALWGDPTFDTTENRVFRKLTHNKISHRSLVFAVVVPPGSYVPDSASYPFFRVTFKHSPVAGAGTVALTAMYAPDGTALTNGSYPSSAVTGAWTTLTLPGSAVAADIATKGPGIYYVLLRSTAATIGDVTFAEAVGRYNTVPDERLAAV